MQKFNYINFIMRKIDTKIVKDCRECPYGYIYSYSPQICPFDALQKCVEMVSHGSSTNVKIDLNDKGN